MKATKLIRCTFIAASLLSSAAFAANEDVWREYRIENGLPVTPEPSNPCVSPLPLLVQMARTDGDTDVDAITRRFSAMYRFTCASPASTATGGGGEESANGNGHDRPAKAFSCDKQLKELLTQLAHSDGYRPGEPVGCPDD